MGRRHTQQGLTLEDIARGGNERREDLKRVKSKNCFGDEEEAGKVQELKKGQNKWKKKNTFSRKVVFAKAEKSKIANLLFSEKSFAKM